MEINGRIWGSLPLAVAAGVDFPAMMADMFLGRVTEPRPLVGRYPTGVRVKSLPLEISWIAAVLAGQRRYSFLPTPPRSAALRVALELPLTPRWDVQSWADPLPGLVEVERLVASGVERALRRGASRRQTPGGHGPVDGGAE